MAAAHAPRPALVAVDLGTTTCRCIVFDAAGRTLAAAARELPAAHPRPLWAEADPEQWWRAAAAVVREALASGPLDPGSVVGVGLSGLMHAPVLVDAAGAPVAPAMLWMDQRCAPQARAMGAEGRARGIAEDLHLGTSASAPKLRWLAEHAPERLARARHLLLPKDFLRLRLTGEVATDPSDASGTGMFDRRAQAWDLRVADLAGIGASLLPPIRQPSARAGAVTPEAAAATGLRVGTPVAVGGADTLCAGLGVGPLGADRLALYLGTAAWLARSADPGPDGCPRVSVFAATSTTGAVLRWLRSLLDGTPIPGGGEPAGPGPVEAYARLTRLAEAVPPGAEGLFLLPHLMGERAPEHVPDARGALVGLTLRHGPGHIARAALEGTAFQIRRMLAARVDGYGGADGPRALAVCGGGARSALWLRVLAGVTGLPLLVPETVEASALGAAMLAGAAAGAFPLADAQARMVRYTGEVLPDPAETTAYAECFSRYCALDAALAPWFADGAGGGALRA